MGHFLPLKRIVPKQSSPYIYVVPVLIQKCLWKLHIHLHLFFHTCEATEIYIAGYWY
jgi:hypothetical protein